MMKKMRKKMKIQVCFQQYRYLISFFNFFFNSLGSYEYETESEEDDKKETEGSYSYEYETESK